MVCIWYLFGLSSTYFPNKSLKSVKLTEISPKDIIKVNMNTIILDKLHQDHNNKLNIKIYILHSFLLNIKFWNVKQTVQILILSQADTYLVLIFWKLWYLFGMYFLILGTYYYIGTLIRVGKIGWGKHHLSPQASETI